MAGVVWEASTLKLFVTFPLPKEARFVAALVGAAQPISEQSHWLSVHFRQLLGKTAGLDPVSCGGSNPWKKNQRQAGATIISYVAPLIY